MVDTDSLVVVVDNDSVPSTVVVANELLLTLLLWYEMIIPVAVAATIPSKINTSRTARIFSTSNNGT